MTASRPQIDIIISVPTNTMRCSALQTVLSHHAGNGFDNTDLETAVKSVRRAVTVAASAIAPAEKSYSGMTGRTLGAATLCIMQDGIPVGSAHLTPSNEIKVFGAVADVWKGLKHAQELRWNREEWGRTSK